MTTYKDITNMLSKALKCFPKGVPSSVKRDYTLVLLFFKYVSDSYEDELEHAKASYAENTVRIKRSQKYFRFMLSEAKSFSSISCEQNDSLLGQRLRENLLKLEHENSEKLRNVLHPFNFNSMDGFDDNHTRDMVLASLMEVFEGINLRPSELESANLVGDCFQEWLLLFDTQAGKGLSIPMTPSGISKLIAKILSPDYEESIYDPACGTGSLLIEIQKTCQQESVSLWGQEYDAKTWALCQMNFILYNLDNHHVWHGESLSNPLNLSDNHLITYDCIACVPPFNMAHWDNVFHPGVDTEMTPSMDPFRRFEWGVPPSSYCSFAFILHMLKCMNEEKGRMAVIVPQGVLYRVGAEQGIRRRIIEANVLDAVVVLPPRLFSGGPTQLCLMIFKHDRPQNDVLFIDASSEQFFEKGKRLNILQEKDIEAIFTLYQERAYKEGYSIEVSSAEIAEQDYSLRVSLYLSRDDDIEIDFTELESALLSTEHELDLVHSQLEHYLEELGVMDY